MKFENVIIMSDIDGTLVTDEKKLLPRDMEAIDRFREGGGIFTLATGRGYSMAKPIAERVGLDVPAVIFNGSAVYDFKEDKFLWHSALPESAKQIANELIEAFPDIAIEILCRDRVYVPSINRIEREHLALENVQPYMCRVDEIDEESWLKMLIAYPPEIIQNIIDFVNSRPDYTSCAHWVRSENHYFEMLPLGVNKGSGFQRLLEIMGREDAFTVGVGDYNNDIELIDLSSLGVAVGSAQREAKEVADLIVCDNNSGAISEVISYIEQL
ncbi:MAG: HAD family hydrolase [Bacteroides sp.]|nr:HAD family hydrolase [Bacteroides sp.]